MLGALEPKLLRGYGRLLLLSTKTRFQFGGFFVLVEELNTVGDFFPGKRVPVGGLVIAQRGTGIRSGFIGLFEQGFGSKGAGGLNGRFSELQAFGRPPGMNFQF